MMTLINANAKIALIIMFIIINIISADNITFLSIKMRIKKYKTNTSYNTTDICSCITPISTDHYKEIINDKYKRRIYLRKREDRVLLFII
jgi:predicted aconitase